MDVLLAATVFVLVSIATVMLSLRILNLRGRYLERLAERSQGASPFLPSPSLVWHDLVSWIGNYVPASSKDLPRLKRRLLRAGFRRPDAIRFFDGSRAVSTVLLGLTGLAAGIHTEAAGENLLLAVGAACLLGYMLPMQYVQLRIRRRKAAIERGLPNALDLMVVCVEAGLGLDQTTLQVAKELQIAYPEICEEFAVMNLEMRAGKRRVEALHNLADRTGVDDLKKLVAVLIQTDRFGTSIAQSLRSHADYMRVMARQRFEERAAKLAVKLVFPIFFCVLPSLFVVTVGPVLTRLVRDLFPMIEGM